MPAAITLHGTQLSGHAHRVELLLRMLRLPYAYRDAPAAVRAGPEFLGLNPLGQIPVLEDGGLVLADSDAIPAYWAKRCDADGRWPPDEPSAAAVQRWLSIAAGELAHGPAAVRSLALRNAPRGADPVRARAIAGRLLAFMDGHLAAPPAFLAADHPTVADLACHSYVAHVPEGGIPLDPCPAILAWLSRVEALPGFEPMPRSAAPVAA